MTETSNTEPAWKQAHDQAVADGEMGYFDDDSGLYVLTSVFLTNRGNCCSSGCRHCPYGDASDQATEPVTET